jgi:hypothetical protein
MERLIAIREKTAAGARVDAHNPRHVSSVTRKTSLSARRRAPRLPLMSMAALARAYSTSQSISPRTSGGTPSQSAWCRLACVLARGARKT